MKPSDQEMKQAAANIAAELALLDRPVRFMEVCGTHTVSIFKAGIRQLLPENIELVSGPGCPVCVTGSAYMVQAILYSRCSDVIIATFGDMLKVPGSLGTLLQEKAQGADIRIVYSPLDSLKIAREEPDKTVVFLAVGFETTTPTAAATIVTAQQENLRNFAVLPAHKLVPPALKALLDDPLTKIDGFLLPGHVCAVTGLAPFDFLAEQYHMPAVVAGFDPLDILQAVAQLARQAAAGEAGLENEYRRVVKSIGNPVASQLVDTVYEPVDAIWRGIGSVPLSGLALREAYQDFDIRNRLPLPPVTAAEPAGCRCGEVLKGRITPPSCPLFRQVCRPESPVGACMVSVEGTCAAWYKYGDSRWSI